MSAKRWNIKKTSTPVQTQPVIFQTFCENIQHPNRMISVLLVLLGMTHARKLPDGMILCHRSDPKFSDCIGNSITHALQIFANGYKPMRIPVLEPFYVEKMDINEAPFQTISVVLKYSNFFVHGMTKQNISNMRFDLDKGCGWTMDVFSPGLKVIGDLELQGNILMFSLNSKGPCEISLTNVSHHHTMQCEMFSKNEKVYVRFKNYSIVITHLDGVNYALTDLFPANREIEKAILKTINDNAVLLFNEAKSGFEEAFSIIQLEIANLVFSKIPMDEVFLS